MEEEGEEVEIIKPYDQLYSPRHYNFFSTLESKSNLRPNLQRKFEQILMKGNAINK